jgi:hypothetical protein
MRTMAVTAWAAWAKLTGAALRLFDDSIIG